MAKYKQFDYFETPIRCISRFNDYVNPERYSLNALDIYQYIFNIEEDRKAWAWTWNRYKDWSAILLVVMSLLLPIIAYIVIMLTCYLLNLFDVSNIDKKIISYFIGYQTIIIEIQMWNHLRFIDIYNKWIEKKYKKRSQFNRIIEEYLEEVNYNYWKKQENLQ